MQKSSLETLPTNQLEAELDRRKGQRVSHDMVGVQGQQIIIGVLAGVWEDQAITAKEAVHRLSEDGYTFNDKEVRWVFRSFSVEHTTVKPYRYHLTKQKVKK